jgi:hypothetical protein
MAKKVRSVVRVDQRIRLLASEQLQSKPAALMN